MTLGLRESGCALASYIVQENANLHPYTHKPRITNPKSAHYSRNYAQRRIQERFRETATGGETAADKMTTAKQNLELIKRQAIVGNLFGSGETLAHEGRGSKAS